MSKTVFGSRFLIYCGGEQCCPQRLRVIMLLYFRGPVHDCARATRKISQNIRVIYRIIIYYNIIYIRLIYHCIIIVARRTCIRENQYDSRTPRARRGREMEIDNAESIKNPHAEIQVPIYTYLPIRLYNIPVVCIILLFTQNRRVAWGGGGVIIITITIMMMIL